LFPSNFKPLPAAFASTTNTSYELRALVYLVESPRISSQDTVYLEQLYYYQHYLLATAIRMHPEGSTCPPTRPPSLAEATKVLIDIDGLANEYNKLVTKWNCSSPAVRSVLARYKYLTRDGFQKLVDWAKALVRRLGTNYRPINPHLEPPRGVYEMLKRLSESTRQDLEKVRHELATWAEDEGKIDSESRPTISYQSLDEGSLPFHPTDEVRQLRGENTELRNRIEELEELAEKNSLIQSLKDGKGKGRD
jgi:hypothetical protein